MLQVTANFTPCKVMLQKNVFRFDGNKLASEIQMSKNALGVAIVSPD